VKSSPQFAAPDVRMSEDYFALRLAPRAEPKPPLLALVHKGDVAGVQKLLRSFGPADAVKAVQQTVDTSMRTAVHYAAYTGNTSMQQVILRVPQDFLRKRMQQQLRELKQRGSDMARYGTAADTKIFAEWALTERGRLRREMELELDRKHNELLVRAMRRVLACLAASPPPSPTHNPSLAGLALTPLAAPPTPSYTRAPHTVPALPVTGSRSTIAATFLHCATRRARGGHSRRCCAAGAAT